MDHHIRTWGLAGIAVFALMTLQSSVAAADPITITLQSTTTTVVEGDTLTLLFQATNSSTSTYNIGGNGQNMTFVSGDASDIPVFDNFNYSPAGYTSCTAALAPGNSCYFTATYETTADIGETDNDSGVYQVLDETSWYTAGQPVDYVSTYTNITVTDPAPTTAVTPEPTSLAMLATSLAGVGLLRRRFRSN